MYLFVSEMQCLLLSS